MSLRADEIIARFAPPVEGARVVRRAGPRRARL